MRHINKKRRRIFMEDLTRINLLKQIDFGDVDGYGDPNLDQYFLDNDYWKRVVDDGTYFIIGRKGTGKSSIYRMIYRQGIAQGCIIDNKDFGDFPFERLLALDDQSFAKPNQYQSIWKNLILNIYVKQIIDAPMDGDASNIHYQQLKRYADCFVGNIIDLHKDIIARTTKTSVGLSFSSLSANKESEQNYALGRGDNNLTAINSYLEEIIIQYFITCNPNKRIFVQFDRLDDNYNQYQDVEQYYQSIISLFKVVYYFNQKLREKNIKNAKVILYLRSDILKELGKRDAESARWESFSLEINWSIINRDDWKTSKLLQMINKRIQFSTSAEMEFSTIFDKYKIDLCFKRGVCLDVFQYIIDKTMHRPRDLVQFCKFIQQQTRETGKLYYRTIKDAEKEYAFWLVNSELANEINPILKSTEPVYELLKLLGSKPFSLTDFYDRYSYISGLPMDAENLVYYLYYVVIFKNIDTTCSPIKYRSAYRNKGRLDRNMKIIIHPGVWIGINA